MTAFRRQVAICILITSLAAMMAAEVRASDLGRFRGWDKTAAAYYMTDEERAAWKFITTETAAQAFVTAYMARRGPQFEQELERRIGIADQMFSSGRLRGSQTLRGKIIILLGPPGKFEHKSTPQYGRIENLDLANIYTNVGPMGSQSTRLNHAFEVFTFTYTQFVVRVEADPVNGKEQLPSRRAENDLDKILKNAARASVHSAAGSGAAR